LNDEKVFIENNTAVIIIPKVFKNLRVRRMLQLTALIASLIWSPRRPLRKFRRRWLSVLKWAMTGSMAELLFVLTMDAALVG